MSMTEVPPEHDDSSQGYDEYLAEQAEVSFLIHEIRAGRAHFPECPSINIAFPTEEEKMQACICMETLVELDDEDRP